MLRLGLSIVSVPCARLPASVGGLSRLTIRGAASASSSIPIFGDMLGAGVPC